MRPVARARGRGGDCWGSRCHRSSRGHGGGRIGRTAGANGSAGPGAVDAGSRTVAVISPLVRRMARENGLDLRELTGSGRDGLILRTDVECAIRARQERETMGAAGAVARLVPRRWAAPTGCSVPV